MVNRAINNRQSFSGLFTIKYTDRTGKEQTTSLKLVDKLKVLAAFVFGFVRFGNSNAGLASSCQLRNRLIQKLSIRSIIVLPEINNPPEINNEQPDFYESNEVTPDDHPYGVTTELLADEGEETDLFAIDLPAPPPKPIAPKIERGEVDSELDLGLPELDEMG